MLSIIKLKLQIEKLVVLRLLIDEQASRIHGIVHVVNLVSWLLRIRVWLPSFLLLSGKVSRGRKILQIFRGIGRLAKPLLDQLVENSSSPLIIRGMNFIVS